MTPFKRMAPARAMVARNAITAMIQGSVRAAGSRSSGISVGWRKRARRIAGV
jgi:hypothetical protein